MKVITEGIEDHYEENPRTNYERGELRMNLEGMNDKKKILLFEKERQLVGS